MVFMGIALAAPGAFANADIEFDLHISSGSADSTLKNLSLQTGYAVIFQSADVEDIRTKLLTGRYSVQHALDSLLLDTALIGVVTAQGVITVSPRLTKEIEGSSMKNKKSGNTLLRGAAALLTSIAASLASGQEVESNQTPSAQLEELVVTGTYLRRSQANLPSPIEVISNDDLTRRGVSTVAELVRTLTINTGAEGGQDNFTGSGTFGTSNINLRGLGIGSNLVLLNGRRQTQSAVANDDGETFVDTASLVPTIAIERVEILKDGASSLYGSDAISGVVNFITRNDFEGFEFSTNYQTVTEDSQRDLEIGALWGAASERSNVIVALNYLDRTSLTSAERVLPGRRPGVANGPAVSGVGNPGRFVRLASGGPPVADPDCQAVADQSIDQSVIPTATSCLWDFGQYTDIVPEERRATVFSAFNYEFSESLVFNGELAFARNRASRGGSPSFSPLTSLRTIPAAHPQNPFGEDLLFLGRALAADASASIGANESNTWRMAGALAGKFGSSDWDWNLAATYSNNQVEFRQPDTLVDEFQEAINDFSFNPFGSAHLASPGDAAYNDPAIFDRFIDDLTQKSESTLWVAEGHVSGDLIDLPAGALAVAIGAQYREERLVADFNGAANRDEYGFFVGNPDFNASRDVSALFVEFGAPLAENLELQTALRYENYGGDIGDTTDAKVAVLFRPIDALTLRGSFSSSFRAPSLFQANGIQTVVGPVFPPAGPPSFPSTRFTADPNDPLVPEEADVVNVGITLQPAEGLTVNFDYWSFDYSNVIIRESAQILFTDALNGDPVALTQVDFNPISGGVQQIRPFYRNASSLETSGFDLSIDYDLHTGIGLIKLLADSTYIEDYTFNTAQTGEIDGAGRRNVNTIGTSAPQLRANFGALWENESGTRNANIFVRYISSYEDDANNVEPGTDVDAQATVDASYGWNFGDGLAVNIGATNLFDEEVPEAFSAMGYDTKVHDGRQRTVYIGLKKTY